MSNLLFLYDILYADNIVTTEYNLVLLQRLAEQTRTVRDKSFPPDLRTLHLL